MGTRHFATLCLSLCYTKTVNQIQELTASDLRPLTSDLRPLSLLNIPVKVGQYSGANQATPVI
jgi:hypothetical protein